MIKHHDQKKLCEERVYFSLNFQVRLLSTKEVRTGTQGRDLEAETEAEAREEYCLLSLRSYTVHDHPSKV